MLRPSNPFRATSAGSAQFARNRQSYLPPHIEQAMAEHMQHSLPDHLKQYQGGDMYVPQNAADDMTKHLQETLPNHLQQYAGAYVEQNVVQPGLAHINSGAAGAAAGSAQPPQSGQAYAGINPILTGPGPAPAVSAAPMSPAASPVQAPNQPNPAVSPDQPYAFITNSPKAPQPSLLSRLPGGGSLIGRVGLAAGALLVLFIIFLVLKGLLGGPSTQSVALAAVIEDQQELLHLANAATQQSSSTTTTTQNFTATLQLSVGTSQAKLITYTATYAKKTLKPLQLNSKVSATIDNQLTAALATNTYDQTFQQVMQAQLNTYGSDIQRAYKLTTGKNGRALLNDSYRQAQLLAIQLITPIG